MAGIGDVSVASTKHAVTVLTAIPISREDGSYLRFDHNAWLIISDKNNPKGSGIFGPVALDLWQKNVRTKISLAPQVI
jgi:large subunit ribosomal protein L14